MPSSPIAREKFTTSRACRSPSINELYWAAGFIEGEGSFTQGRSVGILVSQVEYGPIKRLLNIFGGQITIVKNRNQKDLYRWSVNGVRARGVCMTLYTLFFAKRRIQIRLMLDWIKYENLTDR